MHKRFYFKTCVIVLSACFILGAKIQLPVHAEENTINDYIAETDVPGTGYIQLEEDEAIPAVMSQADNDINYDYAANYPEKYITSNLPAIRNQGSYGVCWAFSTISLVETNLIKKGITTSEIDLSELHLINFTYKTINDKLNGFEGDNSKYNYDSNINIMNVGGNVELASNSLLDWRGVVNEKDLSYDNDNISKVQNGIVDDSLAYDKDIAHMRGFYKINTTSKEDIKNAVMNNGSVSISYYAISSYYSNEFYNAITAGYYCDDNTLGTNHAVNIVGWDDSYPANNFAKQPDGDGAWIVRNSWGTEYGENGYFYLSYYDKSLYIKGYAVDVDSYDNYDNNYQYDGATRHAYGGYGGNSSKAANVFKAKANAGGYEDIKAVLFENYNAANATYKIYVYTDLTDQSNPESGKLSAQKSGVISYDGAYTIDLDTPVRVAHGESFSVVIELISNGSKTPYIAYDTNVDADWYSSVSSANKNQSFMYNPYYKTWRDLGEEQSSNYVIKAYTDNVKDEYTGLKLENGQLYYYNNGVKDSSYTGFVNYNETKYYVIKGVVDNTYTDIIQYESDWVYVENGQVRYDYTGIKKNSEGWMRIKNGKVDFEYTGLADNEYGRFYIQNGKVDFTYTDIIQDGTDWVYVENGQVRYDYTGIRKNAYGWWRIRDGKVDFKYTGLADNEYGRFYIQNGKVNFNYTDVIQDGTDWVNVENGQVRYDYTGIRKNAYGWWRIRDGKVDFNFTGIASNEYGEYYINGGKVMFNYNGIYIQNDITYTIKDGQVVNKI